MPDAPDGEITLAQIRAHLYSAVVSDALDGLGYPRQSPDVPLQHYSGSVLLVGRCRTTLWQEVVAVDEKDPAPYELELRAVDACERDDVLIAAAGGSRRSGIWGELLSTAARHRGCAGALVDGCTRDVRQLRAMQFSVYARATNPYDSRDRQKVVALDLTVEIGGVSFLPGALVIADEDGVVVVPPEIEREAIRRAWQKVHDENEVRDAIRRGMSASEAFERYGVL